MHVLIYLIFICFSVFMDKIRVLYNLDKIADDKIWRWSDIHWYFLFSFHISQGNLMIFIQHWIFHENVIPLMYETKINLTWKRNVIKCEMLDVKYTKMYHLMLALRYSVVQITSDRFGEICKFRSRGSLTLLSLGVGIDQWQTS